MCPNRTHYHPPFSYDGATIALSTLLNPFAPHITEEVWQKNGLGEDLLCRQSWPSYKNLGIVNKDVNIVVQVNGKIRDTFSAKSDLGEQDALNVALELSKIKKFLDGKKIVKHIYVKGKILNLVVE